MNRKYFGTDGVRGVANGSLLTPEFVLALGQAAASILPRTEAGFIIIGRDSRISGPMLESALTAGITSAGRQTVSLGVVPTPAVSYLTAHTQADFGIMISASHNPVPDNGIKIFSSTGHKLADKIELSIEQELQRILEGGEIQSRPVGTKLPVPTTNNQLIEQYMEHLIKLLPLSLHNINIVCDAAYGSAAPWVHKIFTLAGANVVVINGEPDGYKINVNCGSTDTQVLQREVIKQRADLGLAFDGDADRLIAIDNCGNVVDGDYILYILATHLHQTGKLTSPAVVGTVMSNMGLEKSLQKQGLSLIRAKVGDRYVCEQMTSQQINLGGEQSGHIINSNWAITGDGMLNGLQLAAVVKQSSKPLSELCRGMEVFPQCLINVEVADKERTMANEQLLATKQKVEQQLFGQGRIVLRPSGTQQLIRVMVEAESKDLANETAELIAEVVRKVSG